MKFSKEEILRSIITSKILDQYLEQNSELREMIDDFENSNIHYDKEYVPTIYQKEIIERRIKHGKNADKLSRVNAHALEKVKSFIEKYPQNNIFDITFNCRDTHISVWCGLLDSNIEILCVMQGEHIPEYAFKESKE